VAHPFPIFRIRMVISAGARRPGTAAYQDDSEIVRPSALAVLRLTASSNFSADCTGNSLGLAPFKIFVDVDASAPVHVG
jgi:hypothetical protein